MSDGWVDWVAVHRAVDGWRPVGRALTAAERAEVARQLYARGATRNEVAVHMQVRAARLDELMAEWPPSPCPDVPWLTAA